ncbi:MAG: alpha/beta hydrolase [Cytophagales bacterium]|nr:alpha/beta hydrolase [Cytophagales bacterium]
MKRNGSGITVLLRAYCSSLFCCILMLTGCQPLFGQVRSETFEFDFEGKKYSGLIDIPGKTPYALIVLVPGSGRTNMVAGDEYYKNLRSQFVRFGLACAVYDKAGCGKSEGIFDYNQSVQNSSEEVLAAIRELRELKVPGADNIGLWGISRGGWICPLVIAKDPNVSFWISVSGPDHLETIGYLFEANWRIQGKSEPEIKQLASEWLDGFTIQRKGGSYEEYLEASPNLSKDSLILALRGGKFNTRENYLSFQKVLQNQMFDEETGLTIVVPEFTEILSAIKCPVLAIFGERDSQVHWRRTLALYKETLGASHNLTIKTLPNCNHNILSCETGGYFERLEDLKLKGLGQPCEGYYDEMFTWLSELGFTK